MVNALKYKCETQLTTVKKQSCPSFTSQDLKLSVVLLALAKRACLTLKFEVSDEELESK